VTFFERQRFGAEANLATCTRASIRVVDRMMITPIIVTGHAP